MNTVNLAWPSFIIDLAIVHTYFKNNLSSVYDGLVGEPDKLTVIFKNTPLDTDITDISTYWDSLNEDMFNKSDNLEYQMLERMAWGSQVIINFRFYTLSISDADGIELLGNLSTIKDLLELGMLAAAGDILQNMPADPTLDSQYNESITVRQYFYNMIMTGGPTP